MLFCALFFWGGGEGVRGRLALNSQREPIGSGCANLFLFLFCLCPVDWLCFHRTAWCVIVHNIVNVECVSMDTVPKAVSRAGRKPLPIPYTDQRSRPYGYQVKKKTSEALCTAAVARLRSHQHSRGRHLQAAGGGRRTHALLHAPPSRVA